MTKPVSIHLLGPPTITYDDAPLKLTRRAHRALLFYLACHNQPVPRSELLLLLWQDASPKAGRARLREMLARVRSELPAENRLAVDRELVELVEDGFEIDVRRFEALTAEVLRPLVQLLPSTPLPESLRSKLVEAVGLWRTPHFMEGAELPKSEGLETWLIQERQRLEASYVRLLVRLAEHESVLGSFAAAENWLKLALECSPFNDILHAHLITAYVKQNHWSEALNHIQYIEKLYQQDGSGITPALTELARHVRERAALAPEDQSTRWPGRQTVRVPMFGRQNELEQSQAAFRRGAITLIYGEAGSGKTRLVQELAANLDSSPRLLAASARALEGGMPFQPLVELLRLEVKPSEWRELARNWQSALALMLPELVQILGVQPPVSPAALSQPLLFEALHQLLLLLRKQQRLLILLDDAQWCDKTSLEALAYLIERKFFGTQAALILAARVEESNPALSHFITHLPEIPSPVILHLAPLDSNSVAKIIRFVLGFEPSPSLSQRLQQDTGGNPLFLLETLRMLVDYNIPQEQIEATERVPVASSIQALIRERLKHLSAHAHQTLHLAAVIGSQIPLVVLHNASTIQTERLVEAIEELEQFHLLQADSQIVPGGGYRFIHEKIRELVLQELGLARRQMIHLRVAEALEAIPTSQSAVLAGHYEQAGEALLAFNHWFKAAQHARKLYSIPEAGAAFQQAAQIIEQYRETIPDDAIYRLHLSWGELAFDTANASLADHLFTDLMQIGQSRSSKLLLTAAHLGFATLYDLLDQAEKGLWHLREAELFLPDLAYPELQLLSYYRRGGFLIISNRYHEAIQNLEQARGLAGQINAAASAEVLAGLDYRLAFAKMFNGWPAQSITIANQALKRSRATLNQPNVARALAALSCANYFIGHIHIALDQARDGLKIAQPFNNQRLTGTILTAQAQAELALGFPDAALNAARQALECGRPPHLYRIASQAYRIIGDIFRTLDDPTTAQAMYEAGLAVPQPGYHTLDIQIRLGLLLAKAGRLQEGLALTEEALEFSRQSGMTIFELDATLVKAAILLNSDQSEKAARLAEDCAVQAAHRSLPQLRSYAYLVIGNQAFISGRVDEARQKALLAAQVMRDAHFPYLELSAMRLLAAAEKASGRPAVTTADRIKQLLAELDSNVHSEELRPLFESYRNQQLKHIEPIS